MATREDLNAQAAELGVSDPESLPNIAAVQAAIDAAQGQAETSVLEGQEATDAVKDQIVQHLADPQRNPLPEGAVINFGDPVPFRTAEG